MEKRVVRALISGMASFAASAALAAACIPPPPSGAGPSDDAGPPDSGVDVTAAIPDAPADAPDVDGSDGSVKRVAGDADGDGRADIVWRTLEGPTVTWLMNGATPTLTAPVSLPSGYVAIGRGFFDGDPFTDVLLRNPTTGELAFHAMKGGTKLGFVSLGTFAPTDIFVCVGDFNADGLADTIWRKPIIYNEAGTDYVGGDMMILLNGASEMSTLHEKVPEQWQPLACADFDGDGTDDIFWRNPYSLFTSIWPMKEGGNEGNLGNEGIASSSVTVAGAGDFDMDGKADVLWRDQGDLSAWYAISTWYQQDAGAPPTVALATGASPIAAIGDYDGDGSSDALAVSGVDNSLVIWHTLHQKPASLHVSLHGPSEAVVLR